MNQILLWDNTCRAPDFVIIGPDLGLVALEEDREREVSLLYIGMTRAKEYLCLSYSGESEFTRYFEQVRTNRLQKKKEEQANGS